MSKHKLKSLDELLGKVELSAIQVKFIEKRTERFCLRKSTQRREWLGKNYRIIQGFI